MPVARKISVERKSSVCPHDCPSTCSLEIDIHDGGRIGRVYGAKSNPYTAGVICAKVARYAERVHNPNRLLYPLKRVGPKGSGQFERISWDEAMTVVASKFRETEEAYGSEAVWPYYYAGTMGHVMRNGINALRHIKKYSGQYSTICTTLAWTGYLAGTGTMLGVNPLEMAQSDCIVIWGTNPVHTQVNVMTHVMKARKERGAKLVVIDIYDNATVKQADMPLILRPGTDGALACAVMHILFRDGFADWEYLERYTDHPHELHQHLADKTPQWASDITGLSFEEIEAFAKLIGETKKTFFRLGYGFARQRNGSVNMHAALSIPAVTGAWQYEGGGAFFNYGGIYHWDRKVIEAESYVDPSVRQLDQSQIGRVLTGDAQALRNGPPVRAMLIQNTNPVSVAPEQELVKQGFLRDDLFVCVHEQFMTETALMADIVLPATTFVEHDDIYSAGGQSNIQSGPKLIEPPGECRSNHDVISDLAHRLDVDYSAFKQTSREVADRILEDSGWGTLEQLEEEVHKIIPVTFEDGHFIKGFGFPDGKFRFKPDWATVPNKNNGLTGPWQQMPKMPDHWDVIEEATNLYPFRLATSPARNFLNSSFTETPSSIAKEAYPQVMVHPDDARAAGVATDEWVCLENKRGSVLLRARVFDGVKPGVLIAEGIWPNEAHPDGRGINTLTGADTPAPYGGAAFHDNHVSLRKCKPHEYEGFSG
ncbi:molybdopterin oxidoreductase family protein [Microvirga sp. W0021]|uniref:Molybdopterin oxidoreductase family protein n=1 Tax=Hohaiivirga grylli TaxID=3133970 RepID=A0ABV0BIV6_9HYPH